MKISFIILLALLIVPETSASVKIRIFTALKPETVIISVTNGRYELDAFNGKVAVLSPGEPAIISKYNGKLAVKTRDSDGFIADSILFSGVEADNSFSVIVQGETSIRKYYSGDLRCIPDMETLLLINICDEDKYISGVVRAEGGAGRNREYFKTQAILARTYLYKYINKHAPDGYNLCDDTHCQAFNGISDDSLLNRTALETKDTVVIDRDSSLIIPAFHSNCGGETCSSEEVWLSEQPYLKSVKDPYCKNSRNATWQKRVSGEEWIRLLRSSGYEEVISDLSGFGFTQNTREPQYRHGLFSIPLIKIRNELKLRSAFFSVIPEGDSMLLVGKGYGHGVGLCQEGAMIMASKGFSYRQIINFYFTGVIIGSLKDVTRQVDF